MEFASIRIATACTLLSLSSFRVERIVFRSALVTLRKPTLFSIVTDTAIPKSYL